MATPFETRCEILGEIWLSFRQDEMLKDFVEYNDIGLPLAYTVLEKMAEPTEKGTHFVNETWGLLLAALKISEDTGFDDIEDLIEAQGQAGGREPN